MATRRRASLRGLKAHRGVFYKIFDVIDSKPLDINGHRGKGNRRSLISPFQGNRSLQRLGDIAVPVEAQPVLCERGWHFCALRQWKEPFDESYAPDPESFIAGETAVYRVRPYGKMVAEADKLVASTVELLYRVTPASPERGVGSVGSSASVYPDFTGARVPADEYEVVWAGRGAMPHELRDRQYYQVRDRTSWYFAPTPAELLSSKDVAHVEMGMHPWGTQLVGDHVSHGFEDARSRCPCGKKKARAAPACAACSRPKAAGHQPRTRARCQACREFRVLADIKRVQGRRICGICRAS